MNICSEGHDEVCYEGRNCPACKLREDLETSEERVESTEADLESAKDEIKNLQTELSATLIDLRHAEDAAR